MGASNSQEAIHEYLSKGNFIQIPSQTQYSVYQNSNSYRIAHLTIFCRNELEYALYMTHLKKIQEVTDTIKNCLKLIKIYQDENINLCSSIYVVHILFEVIESDKVTKIDTNFILQYLKQTLDILDSLHQNGLNYQNLSSSNVLVKISGENQFTFYLDLYPLIVGNNGSGMNNLQNLAYIALQLGNKQIESHPLPEKLYLLKNECYFKFGEQFQTLIEKMLLENQTYSSILKFVIQIEKDDKQRKFEKMFQFDDYNFKTNETKVDSRKLRDSTNCLKVKPATPLQLNSTRMSKSRRSVVKQ